MPAKARQFGQRKTARPIRAASANAAEPRAGRYNTPSPERYFASIGSGGTLSLGAPACMVISVIDVIS
jgi:hypothetical protein